MHKVAKFMALFFSCVLTLAVCSFAVDSSNSKVSPNKTERATFYRIGDGESEPSGHTGRANGRDGTRKARTAHVLEDGTIGTELEGAQGATLI
jgi:hypothetical protein